MSRWINHLILCMVIVAASVIALVSVFRTREHTVIELIECLKNPDETVRAQARLRLMQLGDTALPHVIGLLEGENKHARREAVFLLNTFRAYRAESAVPALIRLLDEDDGDLQRGVIETLTSLGPKARDAVPKLRIVLKEKRVFVAADVSPISQRPFRFVPNALTRIQGKDGLPHLLEHLNDPDVSVEIADAINMLDPEAMRAQSKLGEIKTNSDGTLQGSAGAAIAKTQLPP